MNSHQRRKLRRAQDRSFDSFLQWCAEQCRCCPVCSPTVCDAVGQGAGCERVCVCDEIDYGYDVDYDEEED